MAGPGCVGIVDIEVYFPKTFVDQTDLEIADGCVGKYTKGLGQLKMAVCSDREDVNSIMLTVVRNMMDRRGMTGKEIGFLEVGTETLLDKSKATKTVLMQLFETCGNYDIAGLDTKNACFGGTAALFNAVNWVESSAYDGRYAMVVCGDIAVYGSKEARPTGGGGAVAILVGPDAALIMDRGVRCHYMTHCYDFYKPNMEAEYPMVDGPLSIKCYQQAVDYCYANYKKRAADLYSGPISVAGGPDYLCFHSPFTKLVQKSFGRLLFNDVKDNSDSQSCDSLKKYKDLPYDQTLGNRELETAYLAASSEIFTRKVDPSLLLARNLGNNYTATLYCCLASLLHNIELQNLLSKKIVLFSYGSGLSACMFSVTVTGSQEKLAGLKSSVDSISGRLNGRTKLSPDEFIARLNLREEAHNKAPFSPKGSINELFPGTYYLEEVDDKYRRIYKRFMS